jgi:glycopeptide antibiotics resistance protein
MLLRHPVLSLTTFAYLALVGWITLSPLDTPSQFGILWTLAEFFDAHSATGWITFARLEFMANVLMFVPVGIFLVLLLGRRFWWLAIVPGIAMTGAIEFSQQFIANRVSDPRDLAANAMGVVVGTLVALALTAAKARRIRLASKVRLVA